MQTRCMSLQGRLTTAMWQLFVQKPPKVHLFQIFHPPPYTYPLPFLPFHLRQPQSTSACDEFLPDITGTTLTHLLSPLGKIVCAGKEVGHSRINFHARVEGGWLRVEAAHLLAVPLPQPHPSGKAVPVVWGGVSNHCVGEWDHSRYIWDGGDWSVLDNQRNEMDGFFRLMARWHSHRFCTTRRATKLEERTFWEVLSKNRPGGSDQLPPVQVNADATQIGLRVTNLANF